MAKRVRDYRRIAMTAKTAQKIEEWLVDKTFFDHKRRCLGKPAWPISVSECPHRETLSLDVAEAIARGLVINSKRATLDIKCPYSTADADESIRVLMTMAGRLRDFSRGEKRQLKDACFRVAEEIEAYANRNAMLVIAEAAL
jgi:hypothetical protein